MLPLLPRAPYRIAVEATDVPRRSPFETGRAWIGDPRAGHWQQEITERLDGRVPVTRHEPASPERAAQLEQAYRRNGREAHAPPFPEHLRAALSDADARMAPLRYVARNNRCNTALHALAMEAMP